MKSTANLMVICDPLSALSEADAEKWKVILGNQIRLHFLDQWYQTNYKLGSPSQGLRETLKSQLSARLSTIKDPTYILLHGYAGILALETLIVMRGTLRGLIWVNPRAVFQRSSRWPGFLHWVTTWQTIWKERRFLKKLNPNIIRRIRVLPQFNLLRIMDSALQIGQVDLDGVPVLMLSGDRDPMLSSSVAEELNVELAHSELVRFAGLSQNPLHENHTLVLHFVKRFLQEREHNLHKKWYQSSKNKDHTYSYT